MTQRRRKPFILEIDEGALPEAPSPADAPPIEDAPPAAAENALRFARRRRRLSVAATLFWTSTVSLVVLAIAVTLQSFVADLFARLALLGWVGVVLLSVLAGTIVVFALREAAGLARLGRVEALREKAIAGVRDGGPAAEAALDGLAKLYAARTDTRDALAGLAEARAETPDRDELLRFAERRLMAPLDRRAERAVAEGARDVAAATALIPVSVLDVAVVLYVNLRMIRRVAEVYGGRAGWLGSWRLLRAVAANLLATGAIGAVDDLVAPVVGHGVLGRLSRRVGEAAVNASLCARVGVAAIDVCRPLPFTVRPAPRARNIVVSALGTWRRDPDAPAPGRDES